MNSSQTRGKLKPPDLRTALRAMPNIGDVESGRKIGYQGNGRYIWVSCPVCGKERWIQQRYNHLGYVCVKCSQRGLHPTTYTGTGEPKLGDTVRSCDVGYIGRGLRVWSACPSCGTESWREKRFKDNLCPKCGIPKGGELRKGNNNPRWSGGRRHAEGYVFLTIGKSHPLFSMAIRVSDRDIYQIAEHRLVMAEHLGRPLVDDEIVHHINGNKSDNRLENLKLLKSNQHHSRLVLDELQGKYRILEIRVTVLEAENALLRSQLEGMSIPNQAEDSSSGVCRDLTGGTLDNRVEGKSTLTGNRETDVLLSSTASLPTSSPALTLAALGNEDEWRCINPPKRGTLNSKEHANPVPMREVTDLSEVRRDCTEGIER